MSKHTGAPPPSVLLLTSFPVCSIFCRYAYQLKGVEIVRCMHWFCPILISWFRGMFQKWSKKGRWETKTCIWATSFVSNQWWAWSFRFAWFREKTGRTGFMLFLYRSLVFIISDSSAQIDCVSTTESFLFLHITSWVTNLVNYDAAHCSSLVEWMARIFINQWTNRWTWYGKYFFKLTLLLIWHILLTCMSHLQ